MSASSMCGWPNAMPNGRLPSGYCRRPATSEQVALAAARHRELNGFWVDDHFEPAESVNVAMAISLRRGGLVTPQIERADERSLDTR